MNTSHFSDHKVLSEQPGSSNHQKAKNCDDNYHSLFEQATDAIMVTDFQGNFTDVNSSTCTMFGYTKEELLQLNVKAVLDEEMLKQKPIRFDLLAAGETMLNERKMLHKDGTVVYVEANAKRFMDNRILVIARDITERKKTEWVLQKSEANLHTIFDTTDTIYVLMDNDLRIISYNPRAFDFAKKELGHDIEISEYFLDYFPLEKRPVLLDFMKEVLTGKRIKYEVSYEQPDGSFNWYHVRMFPISKGDQNVYGLMTAVSDITEKKVLEKKLEEERIMKQHEITNAVITAEENERSEMGRELHDNVNQLLAISRLYLGKAKLTEIESHRKSIDDADSLIAIAINEIRNLSHSLVSPFLEEEGLVKAINYLMRTISKSSTSTFREVSNIDETVISAKLQLVIYRIIQEQMNNILKYAQAKTIVVKLDQADGKVILRIKDDGVGFDTKVKSSGIGLMNIRTRASLYNGEVQIVSSPGNGCELIVKLICN